MLAKLQPVFYEQTKNICTFTNITPVNSSVVCEVFCEKTAQEVKRLPNKSSCVVNLKKIKKIFFGENFEIM